MEYSFLDSVIRAVFISAPELGLLVDWLLKSMLIVLFTGLLIGILSRRLASGSKHLLLMNIYVCTALLPLLTVLARPASAVSDFAPVLFTVEANPTVGNSLTTYANGAIELGIIALTVYLLPTILLLLRLIGSAIRTYRIGNKASDVKTQAIQQQLMGLLRQLNIMRQIRLKYSDEISSPLSFGLFRPLILLPNAARHWEPQILSDVLIHELSHIRRLDWLSMIFAYLVTSFFWLNPLLWIALRKLNEEAENSCDSSVLRYGQSETNYAEHLLDIARNMKGEPRKQLLAQMMWDKSILPIRIRRLLENDMVKAQTHKLFALPLLLLTSALLVTCASTRVMEVDSALRPPPNPNSDSSEVILPVSSIAPQYPLRAAYAGIEGWALTEFTVLENGSVDPGSIVVVDAEPADIFNRASIRAAEKFAFEPIAGSEPMEIAGVQYLFHFELGEPEEGEGSINRTLEPINSVTPEFPAQAESEGIAGGNVWTVFHVTRAGTVQDVIINYSSNDIFNQSAIAAAQQLQFTPRSPGDGIDANVRGDTTGLVRAQYLFWFAK